MMDENKIKSKLKEMSINIDYWKAIPIKIYMYLGYIVRYVDIDNMIIHCVDLGRQFDRHKFNVTEGVLKHITQFGKEE